MFDLSQLRWSELGSLAVMFRHMEALFGQNLADRHERKQKKAVKYLRKCYAEAITKLPADIGNYLRTETNYRELFLFLGACNQEMSRRVEEKRTSETLIFDALDEETRWIFRLVMDSDVQCTIVHLPSGGIALQIPDWPAFQRSLVLENAVLLPDYADAECIEWISGIGTEGSQYILYEQDQEVLRFTVAHAKVECYNCTKGIYYWDNPWIYLDWLIVMLIQKADMPGDHCNEREKELLPLLREFNRLGFLKEYPLLTKLTEECGCNGKRFQKFLQKCGKMNHLRRNQYLCHQEFEPLWRVLFEKIRLSQEGYPVFVEQHCDASVLEKTRQALEKFFHKQGFTGQYPDFEKTDDIRGLHLVENFKQTYFCGLEKGAKMYIHCEEALTEDNQLTIHFLCGTALKQKNTTAQDAYCCCFHGNGKRLFWWVKELALLDDHQTRFSQARTLRLAAIAVKRVHLEKLTKEEKQLIALPSGSWVTLFLLWVLLGGGFFASFMVLGFALIVTLMIGLLDSWRNVWPALCAAPWHYVLIFCWLGFGVSMGIISVLAKRK